MTPLRQYKFYELGAKLQRVVAHRAAVKATDMFVPLMDAQAALDGILKGDPITLDYARADGTTLLAKLGTVFDKHFIDPATRQFRFPAADDMIDSHEMTLLASLVEKFETALAAEFSRKAIYAVPKRGLFDSYALAENADRQFSEEILGRMNDAMREDIRESGKALAFGLGLAAAFHLVRVLEQALVMYVEGVTGHSTAQFKDVWKDGLSRLKNQDKNPHVDGRIVDLLSEVDNRYRSLLSKADAQLDLNEAIIFFSMACSIVTLIMDATQARRPTDGRYKALQEKVEKVISDNGLEDEVPTETLRSSRSA